jgi:undecaprenyl-diphosphatase
MARQVPKLPARGVIALSISLTALTFIWLTMLLGGAGSMDRAIYEAVYAGKRPALLVLARLFTALGDPTFLIAVSLVIAVILWRCGRGRAGLVLIVVTSIGRALGEMQKHWVARARPDLEPHLVIVKTSSFPSGHSASSMIFYLTLALLLAGHGRLRFAAAATAILLAFLVGTSRVMLGVHWPSDVVGGWAFGLLWVLVTLRPAERLFRSDSGMGQTTLR